MDVIADLGNMVEKEDAAFSATTEQLRGFNIQFHRLLNQAGVKADRDKRLSIVGLMFDVNLSTTKQLSSAQCAAFFRILSTRRVELVKFLAQFADQSVHIPRRKQKAQAVRMRGGRFAKCDLSGVIIGYRGDLHEIIPRSMVQKSSSARELIYDPTVTAYLSPQAHRNFHDRETTLEQRDKLFRAVYRVLANHYGITLVEARDIVWITMSKIEAALTTPIPVKLPSIEKE